MNTQIGFILKILLLSTALSFLIKYGGQLIPIPQTNTVAIAIVLFPSVAIGLFLGQIYYKKFM